MRAKSRILFREAKSESLQGKVAEYGHPTVAAQGVGMKTKNCYAIRYDLLETMLVGSAKG